MPIFSWRRPDAERLAAILLAMRAEQPTYAEVGATRGTPPAGYTHRSYTRHLGSGSRVFDRGVVALRTWQAQRHVGATVTPADPPAEGDTVVQLIRVLGLWTIAACRVAYVLDEPDRAGFAYGSLPAHPVRGEEMFVIERNAAGVVRARIDVFSRPNHPLIRLGAPVARLVQRRTTRGYLDGIRAYAVAP